ncbi:hypothetical protein Aab01nite_78640 [Paractinoplanes abujensis]|uniref:Nucleotide-binding universal stress UspA family protein n=1 Tax=Paractinoplanes abujensis TaxID=882441 RepID=A0A7W7G319_9ACTN|nr:universal stress protein [Actinoplanes abujensis]MBB4692246.1 nucleotide-binding universal stress UspA family protein [Actinoplanes abujensis]GID24274.1 hypothetical protein Aab01nite_78640 [Actinoplanes abujensis]
MSKRVIVAATDGMPCGSAAVEWAARQAQRSGCALRIVHAYEWDWYGTRYAEVARVLAAAVADDAYARARLLAPETDIWTDTLIGPLLPRLLEGARFAEMLVVGHGRQGPSSVGREVVSNAPCPVVVVRNERRPQPVA